MFLMTHNRKWRLTLLHLLQEPPKVPHSNWVRLLIELLFILCLINVFLFFFFLTQMKYKCVGDRVKFIGSASGGSIYPSSSSLRCNLVTSTRLFVYVKAKFKFWVFVRSQFFTNFKSWLMCILDYYCKNIVFVVIF